MDVKGNCLTFYRHPAWEEYSMAPCIKRVTGGERERHGGEEVWRVGGGQIISQVPKWNHGLRVIVITQHYLIHYGYLVEVWPNGKWIATPLLRCLSMSDRTEYVNFLIRLKMRWNCVWPWSGTGRLLNNPHIRWMSLWLLSHREHGRLNGREMEPFGLHSSTLYLFFFPFILSVVHLVTYTHTHLSIRCFHLLSQWSLLWRCQKKSFYFFILVVSKLVR